MTLKIVKQVKCIDLIRYVDYCGFEFDRQNGTSHAIYKKPGSPLFVNIPIHAKPVSPGVVGVTLKAMGKTMADFYDFLHSNKRKKKN
jgi:predicted RNA binding protein YcfA (HicA-like mRNA interferase family)